MICHHETLSKVRKSKGKEWFAPVRQGNPRANSSPKIVLTSERSTLGENRAREAGKNKEEPPEVRTTAYIKEAT